MDLEEELDYDVDLDVRSEENLLPCESESSSVGEHSENTQNVFDRYCIKYLKTSECDRTSCRLYHELFVSDLLTEMKLYSSYTHDNSVNPCDFYDELKILHDFLSDASSPPASLIRQMCQAFSAYHLTDEILGMSKILTKQYAQNNSEYLHNAFLAVLFPLRHIYASQDTAVAVILDYICKKCIIPGDCEPKILDNIVKIIERSVHVKDKFKVFKVLIKLEYYVFPQTLLDSLFHYTVRQSQKWVRQNQKNFKLLVSLLLRDSQEEHFFRIWQSSPHFVGRVVAFLKPHPILFRFFRRKLAKFIKTSADDCKTPLLPRGQTSDQRTRVLTGSSTNIHTMSVIHKCTEEHTSLDGQNTKYIHTSGPENVSAVSLDPGVKTLNQDDKAYSSSYRICAGQFSADTSSNTLHEHNCPKIFDAQFNKTDAVFSSEEKNVVVLLGSKDGECCSSTDHSLRPCDLSETLSSSQLASADIEQETFAVEQFLNVSDYQSMLSNLEKCQNSRKVSNLTRHIYNVLRSMDIARVCNSLHGLLTVATQSGKFSVDLKRCLSTISINLLLHMISDKNWQHAYEIIKLIMKHELPYLNCEVYKDVEYSSAKRVLAFAEVCMVNKDFEQAISLLVNYNLLAVKNKQWCLQSIRSDRTMRNELVSILLDKIIKSDVRLTYKFLMYIMEDQKNIEKPINLVKTYEQLLRKLLDQSDESTALQLLKDIYLCHKVPVVYDKMLCRALIVLCVNKNEMNLAKLLIKKGRFLGIYCINSNFFSVVIQSNFTRQEIRMLVEEILNAVDKQQMSVLTSGGEIETDLCFTIVEAADDRQRLPKLLDVNNSIFDAKNRLISVLRLDIFPCLFVNPFQEDSSQFVVHKYVLTKYFLYHLQKPE